VARNKDLLIAQHGFNCDLGVTYRPLSNTFDILNVPIVAKRESEKIIIFLYSQEVRIGTRETARR